ncbi:transcriptional regulator with AbiEi antitoxin domain of type IV toxin-antitoxin system [Rhizobium sullae]|uniref:Transcriptional regulator with AbiEi antitoxin domain of type IV toxin-antitoxin system n=1 Tax=Rhizobium sullae TaxID=50338 RepID=A0A4R3PYV0_RHISU|nr:transcriptional regulator with AbiEi antitoxin domain of type IV toxin-antitoxin system [Rhizobium sullae]
MSLSAWLGDNGISPQLQRRYRLSGWLKAIGTGAMVRSGDTVGWEGALYALQNNAGLPVHPGGRTALSMHGKAHFLELSRAVISLFGPLEVRLPKWVVDGKWGVKIDYHRTSFLPSDLGMVDVENGAFSIRVSTPARALMECLHLSSSAEELIEARELMDGLNSLRPKQVQALLETCRSVKVKRLFLYLADLSGHDWLKHVDRSAIDLGSGTRSLVAEGIYVPQYDIMVPKEFASDAKAGL